LEGGKDDPRFPGSDRRYAHNKPEDLPVTESLKTTVERFMPLWTDTIAPAVKSGKNVIIAAHGNSLRVRPSSHHRKLPYIAKVQQQHLTMRLMQRMTPCIA